MREQSFIAKINFGETIIADKDGKATTKKLEIGKYYAVESSTPNEFVADVSQIYFIIEYEKQNVAVANMALEDKKQVANPTSIGS